MANWVNENFTREIQEESEYIHGASVLRSLEMILHRGFGTSADVWFTACVAFELATGHSLFEDKKGEGYTR